MMNLRLILGTVNSLLRGVEKPAMWVNTYQASVEIAIAPDRLTRERIQLTIIQLDKL